MKRNFYTVLIASLLTVAAHAQCLSSWTYYQPITINNSLAQPLTDFQVKVTVNTATPIAAGHMNANGDDIRFQTTGCAEVNYWIESGINTASTVIWVKVPSLPASGNTTVNMYYGNPAAVAESNGDSVFLFFDDFNDGVFNTTKWETRGTPSQCSESGGILTFTGNGNWEYIRSSVTWNVPTIVETREQAVNVSAGLVIGYAGTDMRYTFRESSPGLKGTTEDPDVSGGNAWFDQNYPAVPHSTTGYHDYEVHPYMQGANIAINNFCDLTASNCNTNTKVMTSSTGTGYYVGFTSYASGYTELVDWIKVRQHASAPPTSTPGSEMLNNEIPLTSLSASSFCQGAGVNVNFTANGTYNAGNTFTAELSDATGSFAVPTPIGTLSSTSTGPQTIAAVIPVSTPAGSAYRIRVTASDVAYTGADNGSNLVVNALPAVSINTYWPVICNGWSDTLVASGAMMYSWNTGPTSAMIIVSPTMSTTYMVTGTDMNGCVDTDTAMVTVNPLPVISASALDGTLCEGESDSLYVSGGNTYSWSTTETSNGIEVMPLATTTYTVTGTDVNGCMNTDSVMVTVSPLPVLSVSSALDTLCAADAATMLSATPAGGTWSGPGMSGSSFDPAAAAIGNNSVVYLYTDSLGCSASDSLSMYVDICLGLASFDANALQLYPNPNNGMFTIESNATIGTIEITDAFGRVVYTDTVQSTRTTLALDSFADGLYMLHTTNGVLRFMVAR